MKHKPAGSGASRRAPRPGHSQSHMQARSLASYAKQVMVFAAALVTFGYLFLLSPLHKEADAIIHRKNGPPEAARQPGGDDNPAVLAAVSPNAEADIALTMVASKYYTMGHDSMLSRPQFASGGVLPPALAEVIAPHPLASDKHVTESCAVFSFDRALWTMTFYSMPTNWGGFAAEPEECRTSVGALPDPAHVHRHVFAWNNTFTHTPVACPTRERDCVQFGSSCDEANKRWIMTPPCCTDVLVYFVHTMGATLDELGVEWMLVGGTLLGAVRDKGFIPYDYDADIMISMAQHEGGWKAISNVIEKTGAIIVPDAWTPRRDCVQIKLFSMILDIWFYTVAHGMVNIPTTTAPNIAEVDTYPLARIPWEGQLVPVPKEYHKICKSMFGESYMEQVECWDKSKKGGGH